MPNILIHIRHYSKYENFICGFVFISGGAQTPEETALQLLCSYPKYEGRLLRRPQTHQSLYQIYDLIAIFDVSQI
jgi:hypothetical protein